MSPLRNTLFLLLALYSLTLLYLEWRFGQSFVRHFFTDINAMHRSVIPHFPFYAINTTLSAFTFWATALIFSVGLLVINPVREIQEKRFFISQVILFIIFGFDDRFMMHETLYRGDLLLAGLGIVELACLIFLGQLKIRPYQTKVYLFISIMWAGAMFSIDLLLPSHLPLRLSVEDLAKLWSVVFFFCFAWEVLKEKISDRWILQAKH